MGSELELAHRLADAADEIAMAYFTGEPIGHREKADGTPVSDADPEIEERLRGILADTRPGDGFLGEEVGAHGSSERRWIVDGIDGTVNFVAGRDEWGTQVALEEGGEVLVGMVTSPARDRRWWAERGAGAWTNADGTTGPVRLRVSERVPPQDVRLTAIPPADVLGGEHRVLLDRLRTSTRYVDPVGHGSAMVAEGQVEACLEFPGGVWDAAPWAVIVEEAGGRWSDTTGDRHLDGAVPVLYSNGVTHEALLEPLGASSA